MQDISDEQTQAKVSIHGFIKNVADVQASAYDSEQKPPLFAPGHEPPEQPQQQQPVYQQPGGIFGGMMGGYFGGGFARSMEMGAGIGLGQALINSVFR